PRMIDVPRADKRMDQVERAEVGEEVQKLPSPTTAQEAQEADDGEGGDGKRIERRSQVIVGMEHRIDVQLVGEHSHDLERSGQEVARTGLHIATDLHAG